MKSISYLPSKDEMLLELCPVKDKTAKEIGHYKLWWDQKGNICALSISEYTEESKEFMKDLTTIHLGAIWKGINITEDDIKERRQDLLRKLKEKW